MKKLMILAVGLSLLSGTVPMFGQTTTKQSTKKTKKKKTKTTKSTSN